MFTCWAQGSSPFQSKIRPKIGIGKAQHRLDDVPDRIEYLIVKVKHSVMGINPTQSKHSLIL
jgi:hypothetical protein